MPETRSSSLSPEQFKDFQKSQKLRPKESDFKGKKGYKQFHHDDEGVKRKGPHPVDGYYEWTCDIKPNEGGKLTKDGGESVEMMTPYLRSEEARQSKLMAARPRVRFRDGQGQMREVEEHMAEKAIQRLGIKWRAGGCRVEAGPGGMLFRWIAGGWHPISPGKWCLSTPTTMTNRPPHGKKDGTLSRSYPQLDPDGELWEWIEGEWQRF